MQIEYTVKRGKAAGTILVTHRHMDGKLVARPDRFKESYHRFDTADEAYLAATANGWGLRMSPIEGGAASLIKPEGCNVV